MADKDIHSGHRQRLRARAALEGLDGFQQHEVLEYLLFFKLPRQNTSEIAHALINRFGTVRNVLTASQDELCQVKGVGRTVAAWLMVAGELVEAYYECCTDKNPHVINYRDALRFAMERNADGERYGTYAVCLNASGIVQKVSPVCDSAQWCEPDMYKEILDDLLILHSTGCIILEYVPNHRVAFDAYETQGVQRFASVLRAIEVDLIDVICVDTSTAVSMNMDGMLGENCFGLKHSALAEGYLDPQRRILE